MGRYADKLATLIRQEKCLGFPDSTTEEILEITAGAFIYYRGYDTPEGEETIEDLERRKNEGYGALINDGKLIGFINEKTP